MAFGDLVSAASWEDGGRCADARALDASGVLFPRSIFHGFSLRACAAALCRAMCAGAPLPRARRCAVGAGRSAGQQGGARGHGGPRTVSKSVSGAAALTWGQHTRQHGCLPRCLRASHAAAPVRAAGCRSGRAHAGPVRRGDFHGRWPETGCKRTSGRRRRCRGWRRRR